MPIQRWALKTKQKHQPYAEQPYADDRHIGHPIRGSQRRLTMVQVDLVEIQIGVRAFWVRPVNLDVLQAGNVVAAALAEPLGKPLPWAVGFFFGNLELSMELWTVIAGLSGLDE